MGVEIERKFLINKTLWDKVEKTKGLKISQGYISTDPEKTIRIRIMDDKAFLTLKTKPKGISRHEFEYEVPLKDGHQILTLFTKDPVDKIRYKIIFSEKVWEVDVFSGANEGLILAEIELNDESETFDTPEWAGVEVTDDYRYYNSYLSANPFKNWK